MSIFNLWFTGNLLVINQQRSNLSLLRGTCAVSKRSHFLNFKYKLHSYIALILNLKIIYSDKEKDVMILRSNCRFHEISAILCDNNNNKK